MSNSALKHLENSQRCCVFCLCLCGHSSARREAWVLGMAGHLDKLPASLDQQGAFCPGQIRLNREREGRGLSASHLCLITDSFQHSGTSAGGKTHSAALFRKDQSRMCSPAITTTERTCTNRERVENREEWSRMEEGALPCICISALQTRSQID